MKERILKAKEAYMKYENHLSSFGLVAGFIFDIYVLKRIDMPVENLWIMGHLLISMFGIVALTFYEDKENRERDPFGLYYWMLVLVQFAFGGLLSTFLVFYFRSSTLLVSWPFLAILIFAFVSNELMKESYSRITFQVYYFFLSVFCFTTYFVPIIFGSFGKDVFIFSGFVSLFVTLVLVLLLSFLAKRDYEDNKFHLFSGVILIYVVFNLLYFANIIPPIPLSLKDAGVFHSIKKNLDGNYDILAEKRGFREFFMRYVPVSIKKGEPLYVFSSVFSPTDLDIDIIHRWEYYDESKEEWIQTNKIVLPIYGGREGGYRTYSLSGNVFPGLWSVGIETVGGQVMGRVKFRVYYSDGNVSLISERR